MHCPQRPANVIPIGDIVWASILMITFHLYPVMLLIPLSIFAGVLGEFREAKCRYGGTLWLDRNKTKTLEYASRAVVATAYITLGHSVVPLVFGFNLQSGAFVVSQSVTFFFGYALGMLLWHIAGSLGLFLAMPFALAWDVLGFYNVDQGTWILNPATWHLRASLPIFGARPNSTVAAPGDQIWDINPWGPIVAQIIVAMMFLSVVSIRDRRSHRSAYMIKQHDRMYVGSRTSFVSALAKALPKVSMVVVIAIGLCIVAGIRFVSGSEAAIAFLTLMVIPGFAVLAGVFVWCLQEPAWQMLMYRIRGWKLYRSMLSAPMLALGVATVIGRIFAGAPLIISLALLLEVAFAFQFVLPLAMRSMRIALRISTVWMTWSILVCGSELSRIGVLRVSGVLGWSYVLLDAPQFSVIALPLLVAISSLMLWIGARNCRVVR